MKKLKIIISILFAFLLYTPYIHADMQEITINFPAGGNINLSSQTMLFSGNDVEMDGVINTAVGTATRFCQIYGSINFKDYIYIGHTTQIITGTTTRYYYRSIFNAFSFNSTNNVISSITCAFESEKQLIIDSGPGINKEIFDEETIIEYYKIQAVLMFMILFFYFFYRLIKQNSAPKNIFKRK